MVDGLSAVRSLKSLATLVALMGFNAEAQMAGAQAAQVAQANGVCRELGSWAPKWANVRGYWNLNEGTTSGVARDSGPRAAFDPAQNVTWGAKGKQNSAALFNGEDSGITITDATNLGSLMNSSYTMAAWFKADRYVGPTCAATNDSSICTSGIFVRKGYHGGITIHHTGRIQFAQWYVDGTPNARVAWSPIALDTWYHVVGVMDNAAKSVTIYVNGVQAQTVIFTGTVYSYPASNRYTIGAGDLSQAITGSFRYPYKGAIDEVAIWNTALTAGDIATIYAEQSAGCQN